MSSSNTPPGGIGAGSPTQTSVPSTSCSRAAPSAEARRVSVMALPPVQEKSNTESPNSSGGTSSMRVTLAGSQRFASSFSHRKGRASGERLA